MLGFIRILIIVVVRTALWTLKTQIWTNSQVSENKPLNLLLEKCGHFTKFSEIFTSLPVLPIRPAFRAEYENYGLFTSDAHEHTFWRAEPSFAL